MMDSFLSADIALGVAVDMMMDLFVSDIFFSLQFLLQVTIMDL